MSVYETKSGDFWDVISKEVYGSEMHTDVLIEANPKYVDIFRFPAGIELNVPEIDVKPDYNSLPPWKR